MLRLGRRREACRRLFGDGVLDFSGICEVHPCRCDVHERFPLMRFGLLGHFQAFLRALAVIRGGVHDALVTSDDMHIPKLDMGSRAMDHFFATEFRGRERRPAEAEASFGDPAGRLGGLWCHDPAFDAEPLPGRLPGISRILK